MSGYSEKTTVYEPGRRLHQTTNRLVPWLGLPSLQISEWWISVVYKPFNLWYFIITVWMDYDTIIFLFKIKKNIFFWSGPFLKSLLSLLHHCFCFMFLFFECKLCGILAPWSAIKPAFLHWKVKSLLTIGLPGKSHYVHFLNANSDSVELGWDLRFSTSNKFPMSQGDIAAAGPETTIGGVRS